jgi:N-acyl homoserine lactone hydrolase
MKIHAIQTGTVAVKSRQVNGVGHGLRRRLGTLTDHEWSEPLPIYAFAIEHPEGVIVVDTGETARTSETGYIPRWHPYFLSASANGSHPSRRSDLNWSRLGFSRPTCGGS